MLSRTKNNFKPQNEIKTNYSGTKELVNSENGLINYNKSIVSEFVKMSCGEKNISNLQYVDFGAGTGSLATLFTSHFNISPICIEIDKDLRSHLKANGFTAVEKITEIQEALDFIYSSNVLEHVKNDVEALEEIHSKLKEGGKLAIYVPALPILYSSLDVKVGHYRRYSKRELKAKISASGYRIDKCYYNDSVGFFVGVILKFLEFNPDSGLGSKKSLVFYDRVIWPISHFLDRVGLKYLFGKNLYIFATKVN